MQSNPEEYTRVVEDMEAWIKPTGWRWADPRWAALAESDLICPNGHQLELDNPTCQCGEKNPVIVAGLL